MLKNDDKIFRFLNNLQARKANMFEAKFANASLFKKIIEAIKDLVTDAPFDCTENSMCLQVYLKKV